MPLKDRLKSFGLSPTVQAALILLAVPLAISTVLHNLRVVEYSRQWVLVDVVAVTFCALWLIARPPRRVRGLIERNNRILATLGVILVIAYAIIRIVWQTMSNVS